MNTKTTKFLAVLAVLAVAFAVFAVTVPGEGMEAQEANTGMTVQIDSETPVSYTEAPTVFTNDTDEYLGHNVTITYYSGSTVFTSYYYEGSAADKRAVTFELENVESAAGLTIVMNGTSGTNTYIYGTATAGSLTMCAPETDSTYSNAGNLRVGTGASNSLVMPEINAWVATYVATAPSIANPGESTQTVTIADYGLLSYDGTNIGATFDDNIVTKTDYLTDDTLYAVGNVATPTGGLYLYAGNSATDYDGTLCITAGSSITGKIYAYKVTTAAAVDTEEKAKAVRSASKLVFDGTIGATKTKNLTAGGDASESAVAGYLTIETPSTDNATTDAIGMINLEIKGTIDITSAVTIAGIIENNGEIILLDGSKIGGTVDDETVGAIITGSGKTTASGTVSVSDSYVSNLVVTGTNVVTIPEGKTFEGMITKDTTKTAEVKLKAGTEAVTLTPGSLTVAGKVDGTYAGSYIYGYDGAALGVLEIVGGALEIGGSVTTSDNVTLTGATLLVSENATLEIGDGKTITLGAGADSTAAVLDVYGTLKLADITDTGSVTGTGIFRVQEGSSVYPTIITSADANIQVVTEGDMEIQYVYDTALGTHDYPANQILIVDGSWTLAKTAKINVSGRLIVPEGATLTINAGAQLNIKDAADLIVNGKLIIDEEITGDDAAAAGILDIQSGKVMVSGQVLVDGIWQIADSQNVEVLEGGAVKIDDSGVLDTNDSTFAIDSGATLTVIGTIGDSTILNAGTVEFNSEFPATQVANIYQTEGGAIVNVKLFTIDSSKYYDAGIVVTDAGLHMYTFRDVTTHDKAYVTVPTYSVVTIDGDLLDPVGLVINPDYQIEIKGIYITSVVTSTTGSTDYGTSKIDEGKYGYKVFSKSMDISGDIEATYTYTGSSSSASTYVAEAFVTIGGDSTVTVTSDLHIRDYTVVELESGTMTLTGHLFTDSSAGQFIKSEGAVFTVSDDGMAELYGKAIKENSNVNATELVIPTTVSSRTVKVYTYVTIDNALAYLASTEDAVSEATVLGKQTITVSEKLNAPDTLIVQGDLYIGKSNGSSVKLTIGEGATLKGAGNIYVYGTMYAEDKTNVKVVESKISADVKTYEVDEKGKIVKDGWAKWTNVFTAIEETTDGTVTITRTSTDTLKATVDVTSNLEIPEDIVLILPANSAPIVLADGVTLTVNGGMQIAAGANIKAQTAFNLVAYKVNVDGTDDDAYSSAIVVNGAIVSAYKIKYAEGTYGTTAGKMTAPTKTLISADGSTGAPIAGAYYMADSYYVISGIDVALEAVNEIDGNIVVNGAVTGGDLVFVATEYLNTIIVSKDTVKYQLYPSASATTTIKNTLTVDSLTLVCAEDLSGAILDVQDSDNVAFNGAVLSLGSAIETKGVNDMKVTVSSKGTMTLTKSTTNVTINQKGDYLDITGGTVYVNLFAPVVTAAYENTVTVYEDATMVATTGLSTITYLDVYGTVSVPATTMFSVKYMHIYGDLEVAAATSTSAAGSFTVADDGYVYIGMDSTDYTAAAAVVAGPVKFADDAAVFISADATVDETFMEALEDADALGIYVESDLWFTIYSVSDFLDEVALTSVPVDNAVLMGWSATDGGSRINFNAGGLIPDYYTVPVGGDYTELYAVLNYDLYTIYVLADQGVHNVSIDGKLMESAPYGSDTFVMRGIDAGTHTVTYTLLDGYEGTAVMKLQKSDNDVTLMGLNFTISGDVAGETYLQLTGITPAPEPEPVTPEEKSEWTITTILLCVLVVLIAIMAVIVALRLNRN